MFHLSELEMTQMPIIMTKDYELAQSIGVLYQHRFTIHVKKGQNDTCVMKLHIYVTTFICYLWIHI